MVDQLLLAPSMVGEVEPDPGPADTTTGQAIAEPVRLDRTQRWVLLIMAAVFGMMVFSVIPWSSLLGGQAGPAEDLVAHATEAAPLWFELDWWFPELATLFVLAAVLVGIVGRFGEKETVLLIGRGIGDMITPALVVLLAQGVAVIMTNTRTLATMLHRMEQLMGGTSTSGYAVITVAINAGLAVLVPSSSGHATLAMPLLAPLSDFAGVARPLTITAWILGHELALLVSPTSVVLVGGLAIAKVGYDRYLRFAWPLLVALFAIAAVTVALAAATG